MIHFETHQTNEISFVEKLCWDMLQEGVSSARSAMHRIVVASAIGGEAYVRTVILRRVDVDAKAVYFHTDARSPKVQHIAASGLLSWLAYEPLYRSQVRLSGSTTVHVGDELCRQHWENTAHFSKRCYLQPYSPSTPIEDPLAAIPGELEKFQYSREESEAGFGNFCVIRTEVSWMDWYYTHHQGNRRAVFSYHNGTLTDAYWQAP